MASAFAIADDLLFRMAQPKILPVSCSAQLSARFSQHEHYVTKVKSNLVTENICNTVAILGYCMINKLLSMVLYFDILWLHFAVMKNVSFEIQISGLDMYQSTGEFLSSFTL